MAAPTGFKPTTGEAQPPLTVETEDPPKLNPDAPKPKPKSEPEPPKAAPAEPKPDAPKATPADAPKATPKPTPKPAPAATTPAGDPARSWNAGRAGTQLGVPPSAVRNLRAGEPVAGIKGLAKGQWNAGQHHAKSAGNLAAKITPTAIGKGGVRLAARLVPGIASVYSGYQAYNAFKQGDYVGAVLNGLGVIPGPAGWIAMAAAAAWEIGGWGDPYPKWAEPDGTNTHMLPAVAKDEAGVADLDKAITGAQRSVFSFQDGPTGTVWGEGPPAALRLDGPNVEAAVDTWLKGIAALFAQIDQVMVQSGEPYFQKQRQTLQPHLKAMSSLSSSDVIAQLKAASDGAGEAYKAVLGANSAVREQLSEKGKITDQAPAKAAASAVETALTRVADADTKLGNICADSPAPAWISVTSAPGRREAPAPAPTPTPAPTPRPNPSPLPGTPTPSTPQPAKPEAPQKTDDALNKLLSQLGKAQAPSAPTMPTSGLGGGSPLGSGSGLGGGTPTGGTPLSQTKPETAKEEPKKLVDDKKPTERKKEELKPLTNAKPEQEKAQTKPAPKPEEKPAVAPVAAVPAAPGAPAPVGQAKAEKPNTEVDVKGQKATFPDPKTAKMAEILAKADPTHPVSLADAAKSAGLVPPVPGQDPGKQVNPADAKPGDLLVAGEKKFMLLGDGKFYDTTDYRVVGSDELPKNLGDRAGYFRLDDANPGQPGQQPVSPQSQTGVQNPVPGATGAPTGPVNGNPPPAPGMPPGGVPSAGAPGAPKPGAPSTGPGNAASTDTGTGQGGPSTAGGQRMDPAAVR